MKMKTKMTILDQELSQSAVGMYDKYMFCVLISCSSRFQYFGNKDYSRVLIYLSVLQWIATHFGYVGLEKSWELWNYVPEFAVLLLLEPIKLQTLN